MRRFILGGAAALALHGGAVHAQSTVQLLDPGVAPREQLRYSFTAGQVDRAQLDMNVQVLLVVEGAATPMGNVPAVRVDMSMRMVGIAEDGSARLEFELRPVPAGSAPDQRGWLRMDPHGRILDGQLEAREGQVTRNRDEVVRAIQETMQRLALPLPEQAVGVGARWQLTQKVDAGPMKLEQVLEYTLRSRDGPRVVLDVKMVDAKLLPGTGLPAGLKLDSLSVSGGGTSRMELHRVAPVTTMDEQTDLTVLEPATGQSMGIRLKMRHAVAPAAE